MPSYKDKFEILDRAIKLNFSHSANPYSLSLIPIDKLNFSLEEFTHVLTISIWKDYSKADLEDYIKLSKECLEID